MKTSFSELSGGIVLNRHEMFALKGGRVSKSYGCKASFCADAKFACKSNKDAELKKRCKTAVCKSGAYACVTREIVIKRHRVTDVHR